MIEKNEFHNYNYIKKEELTGSMEGMRYMLKKKSTEEGDVLEVIIWPGPLNYAKTPEEKKVRKELPFSPEGVEMSVDYLNEQFLANPEKWEAGKSLL